MSNSFGLMDSADSPDDPSGKHYKSAQRHSQKELLYAVLLTSVCIGFVAAQHLYVHHQRWQEQVPVRQLQQSVPRSELEGILQRIAPDREVMIAISNYNLIMEGMLTTWLEVLLSVLTPLQPPFDPHSIMPLIAQCCATDADGH